MQDGIRLQSLTYEGAFSPLNCEGVSWQTENNSRRCFGVNIVPVSSHT